MRQGNIGKEPEYHRKQQEASERQRRAQQEEKVIRTIISVRTGIDGMTAEHAANRQQADAHERGKRKRELSTFWALVAAAGAAIVTLIVSHCDNRAIISESRRIAAQQHADTIAALSKTDAAIASTNRLVSAAKQQAIAASRSVPRAWLYVQFPHFISPIVQIYKGGAIGFSINIPFGVHNYGRTPGTIDDISAWMMVPNTIGTEINSPNDPTKPHGFLRADGSAFLKVNMIGETIPIDGDSSAAAPFSFRSQPNMMSIDIIPKSVLIVVQYRSPNGIVGKTSFYGKLVGAGMTSINDPEYTYWN